MGTRVIQPKVLGAWVLGGILLVGGGCAHRRPEVKDEWLARVPEGQLEGVYQARAQRRQAEDEVARAQLARQDAERELEIARLEWDAAKSQVEAGRLAVRSAESQGEGRRLEQAQFDLQASALAQEAAQAKVRWREETLAAMRQYRELALRQQQAAEAKQALAEYQALQQTGDQRASELREADFFSAVGDAQRKVDQAEERYRQRARSVEQARADWRQLEEQVQGVGGSGRPR